MIALLRQEGSIARSGILGSTVQRRGTLRVRHPGETNDFPICYHTGRFVFIKNPKYIESFYIIITTTIKKKIAFADFCTVTHTEGSSNKARTGKIWPHNRVCVDITAMLLTCEHDIQQKH